MAMGIGITLAVGRSLSQWVLIGTAVPPQVDLREVLGGVRDPIVGLEPDGDGIGQHSPGFGLGQGGIPERSRDVPGEEESSEFTLGPKPRCGAGRQRLLMFSSVSSRARTMELMKDNIDHARNTYEAACLDVYLVHYDSNQSAWISRYGGAWYRRNVQYTAHQSGYKLQLMQRLLSEEQIREYDWVWAVDEDINFADLNISQMLDDARASGSGLTLPAFRQLSMYRNGPRKEEWEFETLRYPVQLPRADCRFRYAPFIEVICPLMRPEALVALLTKCYHCFHEKTSWGVNKIWCSWTARELGLSRHKGCAILDQTPVVHMNFRSLPEKYIPGDTQRTAKAFWAQGVEDADDVRKHHGNDFVTIRNGPQGKDRYYRCVPKDNKAA